jgi:hypothetical protein
MTAADYIQLEALLSAAVVVVCFALGYLGGYTA